MTPQTQKLLKEITESIIADIVNETLPSNEQMKTVRILRKVLPESISLVLKQEQERWIKLNVGSEKEAEYHALAHGIGAEHFMEGFRHARNNLQKQKNLMLKEIID